MSNTSNMYIPPNDPTSPRWLLDLKEWRVQPFNDVPLDTLEGKGYGVVSYTWGYIADYKNPAPDAPEGILWQVPSTTKWPLSKARKVMAEIGTRYIWWDWMCVPQGRHEDLGSELYKVKGEEIGKQLHIYKKAKKSIVWLHSTTWEENSDESSALKGLLLLEMTRPGYTNPKVVQEYAKNVEQWLRDAQKAERWLKSGWTLQEGVLLGDTRLIDGDGRMFFDNRFYNGSHATVRDLAIPVSVLAHNMAEAYFILVEGHAPNRTRPGSGQFGYLLPKTSESETWLRRAVKTLVQSGLVGFFQYSPFYILAGKNSREYHYKEDSCWALVGAMELENVEVRYDLEIEEIKRRFLAALIEKYQWMMLLAPLPERCGKRTVQEGLMQKDFRWIDIVDGALLPISLFLVEPHTDSDLPVPILSLCAEDIHIKGTDNHKIPVFRASKEYITWFRCYRQDDDGLKIVSPRVVSFSEDPLLPVSWFLPLWEVDLKDNVRGKRCLALLRFRSPTEENCPANAAFGGIVDVWGLGPEKVQVNAITLKSA